MSVKIETVNEEVLATTEPVQEAPEKFQESLENIPIKCEDLPELYKDVKPLRRVYGNFVYERQITFLAGKPGVGKSFLAYIIAESAACGADRMRFANIKRDKKQAERFINEVGKLKTLFIDFESDNLQHMDRYTNPKTGRFYGHKGVHRVSYVDMELDAETRLARVMVDIRNGGFQFVVVDNISSFLTDSKNIKAACEFMEKIRDIKFKHGITFLFLAHTKKSADDFDLDLADLYGPAEFGRYADAAFVIQYNRESKKTLQELHIVKSRKIHKEKEAASRALVAICRDDDGYFGQKYFGENEDAELLEQIEMYNERVAGISYEKIGQEVGKSRQTVKKHLEKFEGKDYFLISGENEGGGK